jgi:hypothetical protein
MARGNKPDKRFAFSSFTISTLTQFHAPASRYNQGAGPENTMVKPQGTHGGYARWFNFKCAGTGHVWQNRLYACVLDERHQGETLRYVELNPVCAGLAPDACEWPWSSAQARAIGEDRTGIIEMREWANRWVATGWRDAPGGIESADLLARIRKPAVPW